MLRCSVANLIPSDYCGFKSGLADALAQRVPASPRALAIDRAAASRISEKKYSTRGEDMGIKLRAVLAAFGMVAAVTAMSVQAQTKPTIKLIYTDPLSGPFAQVGDANLKQWQYVISYINATGGALGRKFELIPFDSKTQPAEALLALKAATDQNAPFLVHCSGSNIADTLILRLRPTVRREGQAQEHPAPARISAARETGAARPGAPCLRAGVPQPAVQGGAPGLKCGPVALAWPAAGDPSQSAREQVARWTFIRRRSAEHAPRFWFDV